jgi:hypothetical protein
METTDSLETKFNLVFIGGGPACLGFLVNALKKG